MNINKFFGLTAAAALIAMTANATTLEDVRHLGFVNCGVRLGLLSIEGYMDKILGVDNGWAYRIVKQVGNYAESYERNIGPNTPLRLQRRVNKLWQDGGLHYSMPFR